MWYQLHVLVPNVCFGTNGVFWYRMFILVLACCFHTTCLFWYQLYALVLTNSRCLDTIAWMNKNIVKLAANDGPPFAQRCSHLGGNIHTTRVKAQNQEAWLDLGRKTSLDCWHFHKQGNCMFQCIPLIPGVVK